MLNLYERDYFLHKNQALNNIVASDLKKIIETIECRISDCVIILGGSLAYGEGKWVKSDNGSVVLSDYDIFVIVPSFYKTLRSLISKQFKDILSRKNLSNSLELVFVWEGALRFNLTTVAGDILSGRERGEKILNHLSIPEPANNLKRAFKFLLRGISATENKEKYFKKSIIQAFQALLLFSAKKENAGYEVWKNFYSLRYGLQSAEKYKEYIGELAFRLLIKVLAEELADELPKQQFGFEEFSVIKNLLDMLYHKAKPSLKINDYIRYLTFNIKDGRFPNPVFNSTKYYFKAAYLLLMSVEGINRFDEVNLHEAEIILSKLAGYKRKIGSSEIIFKSLVERLVHYDETYLHKMKLNA